ncbi:MAG: hypothetical protein JSW39_20560 [Desulfobacterales bacterium]|nr:MAG: hypothetical protein JSW39_20560 [Desulfobacterales bacterium]
MEKLFFAFAQLLLVTLVYFVGFRTGYKVSQDKTASLVKEFADPVTALLNQLDEKVDRAIEEENQQGQTHRQ